MLGLILIMLVMGIVGVWGYTAVGGKTVWGSTITAGGSSIVGYFIDGYNNVALWVERGLTGESLAGALFAIGLIAIAIVFVINLIATRGETALR